MRFSIPRARLLRSFGAAFAVPIWLSPISAPAPAPVPQLAPVVVRAEPLPEAVSSHVVVISIDGLRPDAIRTFGAETLQRLMREGSYSLEARTILPSVTLPSHTSMLTGVGPEVHGITWNDNRVATEGRVAVPTIFAQAHEAGLSTAAIVSKGKFHHLLVPGMVDHVDAPEGNDKRFAHRTADQAVRYLETEKPNLMFVHFGEPDYAGHVFGWMGTAYGWAVRRADHAVERVLAAADRAFGEGNYTVILSADHGGHGRTHGTSDRRDVTIPWITWGKGVRAGSIIPAGIHTTDTAITALWLLGVEVPAPRTGRAVRSAFQVDETVLQPVLAARR
jgi:arylsulfatase A-like enzyme